MRIDEIVKSFHDLSDSFKRILPSLAKAFFRNLLIIPLTSENSSDDRAKHLRI